MFDRTEIEQFDEALPQSSSNGRVAVTPRLTRLRKSMGECAKFWLANALVVPFVAILAITIHSEGLRNLLPTFRTRLYSLPVPAAESLRSWQGFAELDCSHVASGLLVLLVSYIWIRTLVEAKGFGSLLEERTRNPVLFWFHVAIGGVILLADGYVFYSGIASKSNGWTEVGGHVPAVCTLLYVAGTAVFAAFHADYATSKNQ